MRNPLIAVCMIVKNEAELLPRCLDSIAGLWDELIIVDTGSRDRTVEIAESYGARVLHYEWVYPGNKGEARNLGIDAATSQWIVVIDADEIIPESARLRTILEKTESNVTGLNMRFGNYEEQNLALVWYQMRVFLRNHYRYEYREHEIPLCCEAIDNRLMCGDVEFQHRPPLQRKASKVSPMLERLKLDVEEHPDDPHSLYMLLRQYGLADEGDKVFPLVEKYIEIDGGLKSDACRVAGIVCLQTDKRAKAYEWWHRATAFEPQRRLLWIELARLYFDDRAYQMGLALAQMAAQLPLSPFQRETQPVEQLAHIYRLIEACQHEIYHQMEHSHAH